MFLYGEWKSLWSVLFAHVFRTIFSNERNKAFNHTFRHSSQKMKTRCDWFFTRLSIVSKFSSIYFQWFSIKLWPYAWLAWRCFSTFCKKKKNIYLYSVCIQSADWKHITQGVITSPTYRYSFLLNQIHGWPEPTNPYILRWDTVRCIYSIFCHQNAIMGANVQNCNNRLPSTNLPMETRTSPTVNYSWLSNMHHLLSYIITLSAATSYFFSWFLTGICLLILFNTTTSNQFPKSGNFQRT